MEDKNEGGKFEKTKYLDVSVVCRAFLNIMKRGKTSGVDEMCFYEGLFILSSSQMFHTGYEG